MSVIELRDLDKARRFIQQGLWLQRVIFPPSPANLRAVLEWSLEIASSGEPLPPVGFVADIGVAAFGMDKGERRPVHDVLPLADPARTLMRQYEDYVLGKIYADWTFERACDALRSPMYEKSRDKSRGLAFLISQFRRQAKFAGVLLSPSILRTMLEVTPEETLNAGRKLLDKDGLMPELELCYQSVIEAARRTAEVLAEADLVALENGIALAEEGQRLAHELVIRASGELRKALPEHQVKPLAGRMEVPTRVLDEDTYPVGGYTAIATRGSLESLLQSQLAYMERDARPDLFDIKYLRDELYFYSRDENQYLRRRRTFVFVFYPDLVQARFKDPDLHYQRIVLLLGLIRSGIQKLVDWLSTDALKFVFVFPGEGGQLSPLQHEYDLLRLLFREQIDNGTVVLLPRSSVILKEKPPAAAGKTPVPNAIDIGAVQELCRGFASRSLCHCLTLSVADRPLQIDDTVVTRLQINGPQPALGYNARDPELEENDWAGTLERLLQIWV